MGQNNFELRQKFSIESARYLPRLLPKNLQQTSPHPPHVHPCAQLHGHSFEILFVFRGPLHPELEWVLDYNTIEHVIRPVLHEIDHRTLNDVAGLENPTTENLTKWLYDRVVKQLPNLYQVEVSETHQTSCRYPV